MRSQLLRALVFLLCLLLAGCGGGGSSPPPVLVTVSVTPVRASVIVGAQLPLMATVQGTTNTAVTWLVNSVAGGSKAFGLIDPTGLYTAPPVPPTPPSVTITALAQADSTKSASASVTVTIGVTVSPATVSLDVSSAQCPVNQQFAATVIGTSNASVEWSVNGVPAGDPNTTFGTITTAGLYAPPATIPNPPAFSVTATSEADASQSASAGVTVSAGGPAVDQAAEGAPIELGTSGGNANDKTNGFCCSGTLGALVARNGGDFILSNNHVLARNDQAQVGESIVQPGLVDTVCVPANSVATFTQAVPLHTTNGAPAVADAALAQVVAGQVDPSGAILQLGVLNCGLAQPAPPANTTVAPAVGMAVAKSGRTTGLTCGTISEIAVDGLKVQYQNTCGSNVSFTVTYNNQVVIESSTFGDAGDSGSLIVEADTAQPTALMFSGDPSSGTTVANPIQDVLAALPDPSNHALPTIVGGSKHAVAACGPSSSSAASPQNSLATAMQPSEAAMAHAKLVKSNYLGTFAADPAVLGVGVGAGESPGEAAIVVFVERGKPHRQFPPSLDGVRVAIRTIGPIRAFGGSNCPAGEIVGLPRDRLR
jgi:hypothetical protein